MFDAIEQYPKATDVNTIYTYLISAVEGLKPLLNEKEIE